MDICIRICTRACVYVSARVYMYTDGYVFIDVVVWQRPVCA